MSYIHPNDYYRSYHGHTYNHLQIVYNGLSKNKKDKIYLAGDSSLDNKFWLNNNFVSAVDDYKLFLKPSLMKPDVCYQIIQLCISKNLPYSVINCAVEESTIANRLNDGLLTQDKFIRDNIRSDDILIVSVGGNDIALSPSGSTIWNIIKLLTLNSLDSIKTNPLNAWGMPYFINMFQTKVKEYILKIIGTTRPKKILICMIYFPDENMTGGGWADTTLGYLGYNSNPIKLQEMIRQIFIHATSKITIDGSEVIPVPMFDVMDGKDSSDYIQRVEPSEKGGLKMAQQFISFI